MYLVKPRGLSEKTEVKYSAALLSDVVNDLIVTVVGSLTHTTCAVYFSPKL